MKKYKINLCLTYSMTPYVPTFALYNLDIWKYNIAPLLMECGFIHLGDALVLGNENNLIEFKMNWTNNKNFVVIIEEMIDKPSYT